MKRIALAFLLLPLLFCHAEETADELFLRSTVRNPQLILWSCASKERYTDEFIANIDKSMELLHYQLDFGLGINPAMFFSDIAKALPEKLLFTSVNTPGEHLDTFGFDHLLALKTIKPMNAQLFIGGVQTLATVTQSPKPTVTDTGISIVIGNFPLTLQFLAGNTILLLGHTSTINEIKEGKSAPLVFPPAVAQPSTPFFLHIAAPPALQSMIAENLPEGFPPELALVNTATLTINYDSILKLALTASFQTESTAETIAKQLGQWREQATALCKDEPTLAKYLAKTEISTAGTSCRVTAEMPWQVLVGAIPAGMILPALSTAREKARAISCVSNLKQVALFILMYATDHDDMLPAPDTWEKDIKPYYTGVNDKVFFCPAAPDHKYIYYGKKAKLSDIQHPSKTILMSENIENHSKNHTINICFVDGHVESVQVNDEATIEEIAEKHHFEFIR